MSINLQEVLHTLSAIGTQPEWREEQPTAAESAAALMLRRAQAAKRGDYGCALDCLDAANLIEMQDQQINEARDITAALVDEIRQLRQDLDDMRAAR